jgi:hypothetical protein
MRPHLQYLSYVLWHKWYVLVAGIWLGVPLRQLLVHDWTKFTPTEWSPYVRRFYGPKPPALGATGYSHQPGDDLAFDRAWEHHWRHNPHHWQYWANERPEPLPMPEVYAREMVADWYGAGMAQGKPDIRGWYEATKASRTLHPHTQALVEALLEELCGK